MDRFLRSVLHCQGNYDIISPPLDRIILYDTSVTTPLIVFMLIPPAGTVGLGTWGLDQLNQGQLHPRGKPQPLSHLPLVHFLCLCSVHFFSFFLVHVLGTMPVTKGPRLRPSRTESCDAEGFQQLVSRISRSTHQGKLPSTPSHLNYHTEECVNYPNISLPYLDLLFTYRDFLTTGAEQRPPRDARCRRVYCAGATTLPPSNT